jgi:hypothetical protein
MARMGFYYNREVYIPIGWHSENSYHMEETLLEEIKNSVFTILTLNPKY